MFVPRLAAAQPPPPGMCDPGAIYGTSSDCRKFLLDYIAAEPAGGGIDVAFWFMEDSRYTTALIAAQQRGVKIRVLVDPRANATNRYNADRLAELQGAGIPMRQRIASGILHWKTMIFARQGVVEFSGANYSADAWRPADPTQPFGNYTDESIYFSTKPSVFASFQSKYDDLWTDTINYSNYANVTGPLTRSWGPPVTKDPELNFPPGESYASRAIARYKAEVAPTGSIDVIMYRITDARHADQMIAAVKRGVPVRLITEPEQYRDVTRLWHSYNVDRMYMGGVQIRHRTHLGLNHQKSVLLNGQKMVIFGSSNWSSASDNSQQEHNYFTTDPQIFDWFTEQFDRKWNNPDENGPFTPLPPDKPSNRAPANKATAQPTAMTLQWYAGPWAHKYDVYLGTSSNPPLVASDLPLGPSETTAELQSYTVTTPLIPGTTYYWRIVSKTMANMTASGPTYSFTTDGQPPPPSVNGTLGAGDILLYAAHASARAGAWNLVSDRTAAGAMAMWQMDASAAKLTTASANPPNFFELTFTPQAGVPYRLWIRGKADNNSWANDSAFLQFSNSVDGSGNPIYRIGTTSATTISIEDCNGCGVHGWGWQDNGYGLNTFGPTIRFASTPGPQTLRVQTREDGLRIDQIMLSPQAPFLTGPPGAYKDDATIYPERTSAGTAPSVTLLRAPYLQSVGFDRGTIVWTTPQAGPASVSFAPAGGSSTSVSAVSTLFPNSKTGLPDYYQHVASLTGLSPSTRYTYHVIVQGVDLGSMTDQFTTAPANGSGTVRFVAIGDSGTGSNDQKQIAALLSGESFDLMLHGGDIAYGSADGTGDGSYKTLEDWFFSIYASILRTHPVFPAMGNHEVRASNNNGQHYLDDFVLPRNGATQAYPDHAERFYSFDYGPMHVVVLDTELAFQDTTRRAAQLAWLDNDLATTTQPWKIAVYHRAPYSSGGEHGSDLSVRAAFGPILEARGVQLVINAHEHDYERTNPINESNPSNAGVTYVVTGGGGAPLYPAGSSTWTAYSESRYEYLRGSADACNLTINAVGLDSSVFDSVSLTQCTAPPDTEAPTAQITSPAGGATISGVAAVDVDATDNVAVTGVELLVDGQVAGTDGEEPFAFTVDTSTLTNGPHQLQARAYDAANHAGLSAIVNVSVANAAPDTQAPATSITSPSNGATVAAGSMVSATASDDRGVTKVELWVDGALASTDTTAPYSFTLSTSLAPRTYVLQTKAYDAANNTGVSSAVSVSVTGAVASDIVLYASDATITGTKWTVVNDSAAAGGKRLYNTNANVPKIVTALASPASYIELTFSPVANQPYHLWMRGKALSNSYANDSVFVQFLDADQAGEAIGTTIAAEYNLEDCNDCGLSGWGWQDNGWNSFGPDIVFPTGGLHRMRIQSREDGLSIDQIVLSPNTYRTVAPGPLKNDATILPKSGDPQPITDTTAPTASITSPGSGAQVTGTVNVTIAAADNVAVTSVDLLVDSVLAATTTATPYAFAWNTASLSGSHTLQARAKDTAGNTGVSTIVTVTIATNPPPPTGDIVLYAADAAIAGTAWERVDDTTAAGGKRLWNRNYDVPKILTASALPASYIELTFTATANRPYHFWMRGKAESNKYTNDSAFVQFSEPDGTPTPGYGIGTTSALEYTLEDCSGCGESGWGWQDNRYGGFGADIVFTQSGVHTIRIQTREDGLSVDQIVLSPSTYLTVAPGGLKNDTTILPKQ